MVDEVTESIPDPGAKRLSRGRRQMLLQIAAGALILVCGIVIGSSGTLLLFKEDIVPDRLPPSREIVRDMQARYNLTAEQTEKAEAALADSRERMGTQFAEMREKMDAEFKQLSAVMKEIFTPEQFEQWENDLTSRRRRPGRFGPGGPGPGGRDRFGPGRPPGPGRLDRGGPGGSRRSGRREPNSAPEQQ